MRILVVTNMYPGYDKKYPYVGIFVKEQVDCLVGRHAVEVLVIEGFRGFLHYVWGFFRAWKTCLLGRYDVVHVHYGLTAAFIALLPAALKKKVVVTLHGGDILPAQGRHVQVAITRRCIAHAGLVLSVSEEMAQAARPHARRVEILPCGVDDHFFQPIPAGSGPLPVKVIFPGDPQRAVKNHGLFQAVVTAYQDLFGPVEVVVLHKLTRQQVLQAMQTGSALLLTSISEGSPQVVKEALACDIAVVSSDVGDVRELMAATPGTGIFPAAATPDVIARLLHGCIQQRAAFPGARRQRVRAAGVSADQVMQRLEAFYSSLAQRP